MEINSQRHHSAADNYSSHLANAPNHIQTQATAHFQETDERNYHGPQPPLTPDTPLTALANTIDQQAGGSLAADDPKRPRSCEKCRSLKVKCEFDDASIDGRCLRCTKANRACVVTQPVRKRQKRDTDGGSSRVLELERKVDALTATLRAQVDSGSSAGAFGHHVVSPELHRSDEPLPSYTSPHGAPGSATRLAHDAASLATQSPTFSPNRGIGRTLSSTSPQVSTLPERKHDETESDALARTPFLLNVDYAQRKSPSAGPVPKKPQFMDTYVDVIDQGIVSIEVAIDMFDCYVEKMAIHMPAVIFSPETTAHEVRKEKPTLFLAILSAASGAKYPAMQSVLDREIMRIYAERIMIMGEKSLELVQALLVNTLWYHPPEHFQNIQFYQLIHIAAIMATEMGMNKASKAHAKGRKAWLKTPWPDSDSAESRRAWLACYFLCCNAAMGLRRANLIRWSSFISDSVIFLETSPYANPLDRVLTNHVRSLHIAEDIGVQFAMDEHGADICITQPKIHYALRGFERDLEKFRAQMPSDVATREYCL